MVKAEKEDATVKAVLQFMTSQNRPYSTNDLVGSTALKELGKAAIQKSLDQLVVVCHYYFNHSSHLTKSSVPMNFLQAGKVKEKTYNKQKVYCIDQELVSSSSNPADISAMDDKILTLTRENAEDDAAIKKAEAELKALRSSISTKEAAAQLAQVPTSYLTTITTNTYKFTLHFLQIQEENEKMEKKLELLSENKVKVSAADFKKAQQLKEKSTTEL